MDTPIRSRVRHRRIADLYRLMVVALVVPVLGAASAQETSSKIPRDDLAKNNKLFLNLASRAMKWEEPTDPVKIAGPIYFVGTKGLGSYLIVTKEGSILLNTGMPSSGPMIAESIKKLGFKLKDIKLIINGHAHSDHAGAFAYMKEQTGAEVAIMREEVQAIIDGGKDDFHYGWDWKVMGFPPCKVDRVLRDEDTIKMGEVLLTAHHTPGHTRGSTTWIANIVADGKALVVIWPEGTSINPGYRVAKNPSYSGINADFRRTLHFLEKQKPDIFLGSHSDFFGFAEKSQRAAKEGMDTWINPEEYRRFVAGRRRAFEDQVDLEMSLAKPEKKTSSTIPKEDSSVSVKRHNPNEQEEKAIWQLKRDVEARQRELNRSERDLAEARARLALAEGKRDTAIAELRKAVDCYQFEVQWIQNHVNWFCDPRELMTEAQWDLAKARVWLAEVSEDSDTLVSEWKKIVGFHEERLQTIRKLEKFLAVDPTDTNSAQEALDRAREKLKSAEQTKKSKRD